MAKMRLNIFNWLRGGSLKRGAEGHLLGAGRGGAACATPLAVAVCLFKLNSSSFSPVCFLLLLLCSFSVCFAAFGLVPTPPPALLLLLHPLLHSLPLTLHLLSLLLPPPSPLCVSPLPAEHCVCFMLQHFFPCLGFGWGRLKGSVQRASYVQHEAANRWRGINNLFHTLQPAMCIHSHRMSLFTFIK